ncbi:hypothetical protein KC19_3G206400 [Ceratodon purpureus]|uniref:Large ribosomal subunit protein uL22c n=1 Tax=Ceratodon purpureus TaxID=3225 RepID=A0A8T0IKS1_CERPU|nr:hypothetical protein KC19_3G206400 [Ceratodon purpureus]
MHCNAFTKRREGSPKTLNPGEHNSGIALPRRERTRHTRTHAHTHSIPTEIERARERETGHGVIAPHRSRASQSVPAPRSPAQAEPAVRGSPLAMWGARGARLWRTLHRIRDGAAAAASRDPSSSSSSLLLRSLASSASSEAGALARDARSRVPAGLLQGALRGVPAVAQQRMGIMTSSVSSQASDGGEEVVRSPLSQAPAPVDAPEGASKLPLMGVKKETQAVLTYIKQSPKKVNLVAELVRGMRVDDALMQMAVSTKRAAKVVAKVITSARANAIHNFGMNKDRLIVAEAFVGKDKYLKRLRIHGKGKAGHMTRPRCRLTVVVKELSAEREAELARIRVQKYHKKVRGPITKLMPHRVLATQWQWARKPRKGSVSVE